MGWAKSPLPVHLPWATVRAGGSGAAGAKPLRVGSPGACSSTACSSQGRFHKSPGSSSVLDPGTCSFQSSPQLGAAHGPISIHSCIQRGSFGCTGSKYFTDTPLICLHAPLLATLQLCPGQEHISHLPAEFAELQMPAHCPGCSRDVATFGWEPRAQWVSLVLLMGSVLGLLVIAFVLGLDVSVMFPQDAGISCSWCRPTAMGGVS